MSTQFLSNMLWPEAVLDRSAEGTSAPLVWLITGTSSGLGRSLVGQVLARGDRVIATSRSLDGVMDLEGTSENLKVLKLDVTAGFDALESTFRDAIALWGRIDVLVNNAGTLITGFLEEGGSTLMRRQYEANVFGLMDVTNACLPHLRAQGGGTIVIVGSRSAWRPEVTGLGAYASSKAAVRALTGTLSVELKPFNIRMLLVEPGSFRTDVVRVDQNHDMSNPIPAYNESREKNYQSYAALNGSQSGDPDKGMAALVDVVKGQGRAKGKPWPTYLVLGPDAEDDVRKKCRLMTSYLDTWGELVRDVNLQ